MQPLAIEATERGRAKWILAHAAERLWREFDAVWRAPPNRAWAIALLLVMCLAVYLRTAGLGWGLIEGRPSPYHDERTIVVGVLNPNYFQEFSDHQLNLPTTFYRGVLLPALVPAWSVGPIRDADRWAIGMRSISAGLGVLTVLAVYVIGARLGGARVGVLAALLIALMPGHWFSSQIVRREAPFIFLAAATLVCCFGLIQRGSRFWYATLGMCLGGGLATSFAFAPYLSLVPLALATRAYKERSWKVALDARLAYLATTAAVTTLILYPYPLLNFARWAEEIPFPLSHGHVHWDLSPAYFGGIWSAYESDDHRYFTMAFGTGITLLSVVAAPVLVVQAIQRAIGRRDGAAEWLLFLVAAFLSFHSLGYPGLPRDRFAILLSPFVAVAVAVLFVPGSWPLAERFPQQWGRTLQVATLVATACVVAYTALFSWSYFRPFALQDPRREFVGWAKLNLGSEKNVGLAHPNTRDSLPLNRTRERIVPIVYEGDRLTQFSFPEYVALERRPTAVEGARDFLPYPADLHEILGAHYTLLATFGRAADVLGFVQPTEVRSPIIDVWMRII